MIPSMILFESIEIHRLLAALLQSPFNPILNYRFECFIFGLTRTILARFVLFVLVVGCLYAI